MEKCTKAGYNEFIVKEKCLNGQNYFLNGRIQNMRMTKKVTKVISAGVATVSSSNFNPFDFIVSLLYFYRRFAGSKKEN